jgi:DNA-binding Xre family transcriptional regulator
MVEKKQRINVAIPVELYSKVTEAYGLTEAVIQGLESVLTSPKTENNSDMLKLQEIRISELQEQISVKDNQIEKLTDTLHAQAIHIQTLLNQKALEAPCDKKKPFWKFW